MDFDAIDAPPVSSLQIQIICNIESIIIRMNLFFLSSVNSYPMLSFDLALNRLIPLAQQASKMVEADI